MDACTDEYMDAWMYPSTDVYMHTCMHDVCTNGRVMHGCVTCMHGGLPQLSSSSFALGDECTLIVSAPLLQESMRLGVDFHDGPVLWTTSSMSQIRFVGEREGLHFIDVTSHLSNTYAHPHVHPCHGV